MTTQEVTWNRLSIGRSIEVNRRKYRRLSTEKEATSEVPAGSLGTPKNSRPKPDLFFFVLAVIFVGPDDHLNEFMTDDVLFVEVNKVDAVQVFEDQLGLFQTTLLAARKIDLGLVAGDDGLGTESDAGKEHLHLFAGGVLGLVKDYEGVGQRAAAHKRQRSDLDNPFLKHLGHSLAVDEVKEGVVQGSKVRIDLVLQIAGQKAETLACLDRRTRQDDAADLFFEECIDGHRDRKKALARSGDADAENEIVVRDRIEIFALVGGLGSDLFLARGIEPRLQEIVFEAIRPIFGDLFESIAKLFVREVIPLVKELREIPEYLLDSPDIALVAVYEKLISASSYAHVQKRFQILDILVLNAKKCVQSLRRKF